MLGPSNDRRKRNRSAIIIAIALLGMLSACGGKPMPFPTPESEMPDRPGLFTGESGVWTLYQK